VRFPASLFLVAEPGLNLALPEIPQPIRQRSMGHASPAVVVQVAELAVALAADHPLRDRLAAAEIMIGALVVDGLAPVRLLAVGVRARHLPIEAQLTQGLELVAALERSREDAALDVLQARPPVHERQAPGGGEARGA